MRTPRGWWRHHKHERWFASLPDRTDEFVALLATGERVPDGVYVISRPVSLGGSSVLNPTGGRMGVFVKPGSDLRLTSLPGDET